MWGTEQNVSLLISIWIFELDDSIRKTIGYPNDSFISPTNHSHWLSDPGTAGVFGLFLIQTEKQTRYDFRRLRISFRNVPFVFFGRKQVIQMLNNNMREWVKDGRTLLLFSLTVPLWSVFSFYLGLTHTIRWGFQKRASVMSWHVSACDATKQKQKHGINNITSHMSSHRSKLKVEALPIHFSSLRIV